MHVIVRTPTKLTERQEALLREFAALDGGSSLAPTRGSLFKKLLDAATRLLHRGMLWMSWVGIVARRQWLQRLA